LDCRIYFQEVGGDSWRSTKPLIPSVSGDFVQVVGLEPKFWQNAAVEPTNFVTGEQGDAQQGHIHRGLLLFN
jgi:hypothetical protein